MIDMIIIDTIPTTTSTFTPAFGNFIVATVLSFPALLLLLATTVTSQVAVYFPSLVVAVIFAVPEDFAVTFPSETVATSSLSLVHITSLLVASVGVIVAVNV